jgi:hypothetical protein
LRPTPPGYRTSGGVGWLAGAKFLLNLGLHPAKNAEERKVLFVLHGVIFIVCQRLLNMLSENNILKYLGKIPGDFTGAASLQPIPQNQQLSRGSSK